MAADVIMPALGMAQETGKVVRWLKREGEAVSMGEPLLEIETDKVTVEIEAPAAGILGAVSARNGDEVEVGTVIAVVLAEGESPGAFEPASDPIAVEITPVVSAVAGPALEQGGARPLASPKARRLAESRGIDIATVAGTGPHGSVTAADVDGVSAAETIGVGVVWRRMAERIQRSWQEVPHFVLWRDVDASSLTQVLAAEREGTGVKVTYTDLLVKLCAEALGRHPRVNASWLDGRIVPGVGVNVAVAVATGDGLVAPVVHGADRLVLASVSARTHELAEAARAGRLQPADVQGGTFTISNLGMYGVDAFQAIVNAPQTAILAVGRIVERPWAIDGNLTVRPAMTLSVSFDHRVVDGARGADFLDTLASLVEKSAGRVS